MGITRTTTMGISSPSTTTPSSLNHSTFLTSESDATTVAAAVSSSIANHSAGEIITPVSEEDADRILKEQMCRLGMSMDSLQEFLQSQHNNLPHDLDHHNSGFDFNHNANVSYNDTYPHHQAETHYGGSEELPDLNDLLTHPDLGIFNTSICQRSWDGILCWPETLVGHTATLSCFNELNGIHYDSTKNATRFCDEGDFGGIWNTTTYDLCLPIPHTTPSTNDGDILALTTTVYFCGYCLSLATVTIAMIIFLAFKELRCLRNTIHTQLIITYILADTMWIITSSTTFTSTSSLPDAQIQQPGSGSGQTVSCVSYLVLHYFHLCRMFWMFVEGLYLYVLVVQTFVAKNIKLRVYMGIGWVLPMAIMVSWAIAKWFAHSKKSVGSQGQSTELDETCPWLEMNDCDWIYKGPVILTLAANSLFLVQIMWVLITKLRSATNPETQQSMKAAKALVVLMPLLGITYLLMLAGSQEAYYEFTRALLISTQGFLVALLFCFLNGEVRKALRHRFNRVHSVGFDCFNCCNFGRRRRMQMQDWSPRSRTESIRLYTPSTHHFRKRGSSSSEATSMTTINTHSALSSVNGSHHRLSTTLTGKFHPTSPLKEEVAINTFF